MEKLGLPRGVTWVAVNIRDSAWLDSISPSTTWRQNSYRDSDSDTYALACQSLINAGLHVVRVGAKVKKRIPISDDYFIDYPFSGAHCEMLDIYLASRCHFMISTGTGVDTVAWMNQIPTLFVNYEPSCLVSGQGVPRRVIFKNFIRRSGSPLTLSEIFNLGLANPYGASLVQQGEIRLEDNTAEEIAEAAMDMECWVSKGLPVEKNTKLQSQLLDLVRNQSRTSFEPGLVPIVVSGFLERHPHWAR
jgi:putative glycosyltransferase (TIGR04372 family)